jgi:aldose 1-epimerase
MAYQARAETRAAAGGFDGTVYVLEDDASGSRAEVWPALGFNCFRWRAPREGKVLELLYADPHLLDNPNPTRNGIPILFPFPNRIRDGRFSWDGKTYQLPLNDPAKKNAIHGFPCRRPWRVVGQGGGADGAWVTGEFVASVDAPETRALWPADYRLRITYRLGAGSLRIEAEVENPDSVSLPFGLGYHPYFRVPLLPGQPETWVEARAHRYWELAESLPTGAHPAVDPKHDLLQPRPFSGLTMDDLLTGLDDSVQPGAGGLCLRGGVRPAPDARGLQVLTSPAFREVVVFTPPHRQAVALEPYTCATDAINLQQRGVDAGLLVLAPGEKWQGVVEMRLAGAAG